jgi:elongation factor Ts
MGVTAALIKELRDITSVGMSDCKNALVEADGNIEKAIEILREKGLANAAKKSGRIATEGLVDAVVSHDNKTAIILEINSETDFVARNDEFKTFVTNMSKQISNSNSKDVDAIMSEKWLAEPSYTTLEALHQKIAVIGENLSLRRFNKFENAGDSVLIAYIHGGKVGVILQLETLAKPEAVEEAGKNICMQIAAMNPMFKSSEEVDKDYIEKEREILTAQVENEGKPKDIVAKIIEGRLKKQLKEICLIEQEYVKDGDLTVQQYVESVAKEIGTSLAIKDFTRYEVGEGLEKKEENFADEVNKVING